MPTFRFATWLAFAALAAGSPTPALAQACEWDGERMICPVHPQDNVSSDSLPFGLRPGWLINLFKPHPRPVDEGFERSLSAYNSSLQVMWENSRALERFVRMKRPRSMGDLNRRVDAILETVWPEYRSQVMEYGLLHAQQRFYQANNPRQRDEIAAIRARLPRDRDYLAQVEQQVRGIEEQIDATRKFEGELAGIALTQLNDHRSERNAVAALLVYAPEPRVTTAMLAKPSPVTAIPGRLAEPAPGIPRAGLAPLRARDGPPTRLIDFALDLPSKSAPIDSKLAVMQSVGHDLQRLRSDLPYVRDAVARLQAENRANAVEEDRETQDLSAVIQRRSSLEDTLANDKDKLSTVNRNLLKTGQAIVYEMLVDAGLDRATDLMTAKVEEIAGAEGLIDKIPRDSRDALVKLASEGGKILLPHKGYERQWETFVGVQERTLGILDRSQGSILEAARLAATGSPAELQSHLDRLFASANDEAVEFIKLVAAGEIPEDENPPILKAFDKYLSLRKDSSER